MHSHTRTYVELGVSTAAYEEIALKLRAAAYGHVFGRNGEIDMEGIALVKSDVSYASERAIAAHELARRIVFETRSPGDPLDDAEKITNVALMLRGEL